MEIQVIDGPRLQHSKIPTVAGAITIGELMGRYQIPEWDSRTEKGYQREPAMTRVQNLSNEIRTEGVDLPTAILVNRRDMKIGDITSKGELKFLSLGNRQDAVQSFYIVDGQHRVRALEILFEEDSEKWAEYQIPFVCMIGADEHQELEMFYVVNSNAKSVKTDLAFELLRNKRTETQVLQKILKVRVKGTKLTLKDW